jgi:hypothetical protein
MAKKRDPSTRRSKSPKTRKSIPTRPNCRTEASRSRPNRFSVRTKTTDNGWAGEVYDLTLTEARKEKNLWEKDGYIAAVFEGRQKRG